MSKKLGASHKASIRLDLSGTNHRWEDHDVLILDFEAVPFPDDELNLVVDALQLDRNETVQLNEILSRTVWDFMLDQTILSRIMRDA